tara:strand:- start:41461 stop:42558 length:1098 start_codon:yes stop_codon:yes gene_type:complete
MPKYSLPDSIDKLSPELLTMLVQERYPGAVVESFTILDSLNYGDGMVSTAARATLNLHYREGTGQSLATRVILKLAYDLADLPWPLYENEVRFYKDLRPELSLEIPETYGAAYDHDSHRFLLLIEDLTIKGAIFPNALRENTLLELEKIISMLANMHAKYWQTPRFLEDLAGLETHVDGVLNEFMHGFAVDYINHEISINPFKQEIMSSLNMTSEEMLAGVKAMQYHQATLPQTLLHGDTHIGNTYILPDGSTGLLDFQLVVRGYCMHDVNYLITTALPIHMRRQHEKALLKFYLAELRSHGVVQPPSFADAWQEYKRCLIWGVYIGWMTCGEENYGWKIQAVNLLRLATAFVDHDTGKLVAQIM